MSRRAWGWASKGALILFVLVAGIVVAFIGFANSESTDCFADFPRKGDAARVLETAHAIGLDNTDLIEHRNSASIRISSGETGDDAAEFRRTVRRLVAQGGGHLEKASPCVERPFFD